MPHLKQEELISIPQLEGANEKPNIFSGVPTFGIYFWGKQYLTAQSIDFKTEAQSGSDMFITWNCFFICASSVELQHVLPL